MSLTTLLNNLVIAQKAVALPNSGASSVVKKLASAEVALLTELVKEVIALQAAVPIAKRT